MTGLLGISVSLDVGGLAALFGTGLGVVAAASVWFTMHRLRHPPRRTNAHAVSRGAPSDPGELSEPIAFETRVIELGDAAVELWEIAGAAPAGPVVIVTPGWGDSKIGALARLEALTPWASRVVAWDPPGLGATPGVCGLGVTETALVRRLTERYAGERGVVLYGWSLGGGVSVAAANDARVLGVIAEAPYREARTPARNVLRGAGLPYRFNLPVAMWLLGLRLGVGAGWRGYDRGNLAAHVRGALLVLHGSRDVVSPIEDGVAIAGAAPGGVLAEIRGGGHNDLWSDPAWRAVCREAVAEWARGLA